MMAIVKLDTHFGKTSLFEAFNTYTKKTDYLTTNRC